MLDVANYYRGPDRACGWRQCYIEKVNKKENTALNSTLVYRLLGSRSTSKDFTIAVFSSCSIIRICLERLNGAFLPVLRSSHFFVKTTSSGSHTHFKEPLRFSLQKREEKIQITFKVSGKKNSNGFVSSHKNSNSRLLTTVLRSRFSKF